MNAKIEERVIINWACTIGHDAIIGNYTTILPGVNLSGFVKIGECSSVGTGAAIIQHVNIGQNTIIGAGTVVIKDLPDNCTALGCLLGQLSVMDN